MTKTYELAIISIITGLFIYYRRLDYYKVIPRKNIMASLLIMLWTYIVLRYSAWFVIVGLVILNVLNKVMSN